MAVPSLAAELQVTPSAGRRRLLRSGLFALTLLAATIGILSLLFVLVGQRAAPDSYPGLRGFPVVGSEPSKLDGDIVTFVFAFLVGFLIQRSRWCNASAIRDAVLFRSFRNTKPLLAGMMVITAMLTIFEAAHIGHPINIVGGMFTVLGLFLFGIGMVLGGACTVSVWIRSAEGSLAALWALIYTFVGMFGFSELWNVMRWPAASYLQTANPKLSILSFGSFNAFTIRSFFGPTWGPVAVIVAGATQVGLLALIYRRLVRIERRSAAGAIGAPGLAAGAPGAPRLAREERAALDDALTTVEDVLAITSREPAPAGCGPVVPVAGGEPAPAPQPAPDPQPAPAALAGPGALAVDRTVDCSGDMCPRPQLLTKRTVLKEMSVGQVLELVVDNPSSPELVPTIMADIGARHLGTTRDERSWHLYIRKEREVAQRKPRRQGGGDK